MTDREAAAGLVERLNEEATYLSRHAWTNGNQDAAIASNVASEAATTITTLLSELESAEKERDEAEHARAEAMTLVELLKGELSHTQSELAGMRRTHMRMSATPDDFGSGGQIYDPDAARAFIDRAKESGS